jgi:hypothetical protein
MQNYFMFKCNLWCQECEAFIQVRGSGGRNFPHPVLLARRWRALQQGTNQGIYALDFQCCSQTLQMYKYFRFTASYFM